MIGKTLCKMLKDKGYQVALLSRQVSSRSEYQTFFWDPDHEVIDKEALQGTDVIIHLAGANIAGGRWTDSRKRIIIRSRVQSADFLFSQVSRQKGQLHTFISASGIDYYGRITSEHIFKETDKPGRDFMAEVCRKWEHAANQFETLGIRTVKIRTGVVLSDEGGALPRLVTPVKAGMGAPLAGGNQYMPWIHITDLCYIYMRAVEKPGLQGAYNAVAPEHVTNKAFMRALAHYLNRPFILPSLPGAVLKLALGEMAVMLTQGSRVSAEKIRMDGFCFRYPDLDSALPDLLKIQQ